MKINFKTGLLLLQIGGLMACTLSGPESKKNQLPIGRFATQSIITVSRVDSNGFQEVWYDTATFVLEITPESKWIHSQTVNDTCMYLKTVSDFQFDGDVVSIIQTHGTRFSTSSSKCEEIAYEYDIDSTWKIPVKIYSNNEIQLIGVELFIEKVLSYKRINEN